ncbi:uncharacterized protein IL334_005178 [Kwoniella shivajii]|uniref:Uncharacterized protein n=1 Tax=Kwoniella shivajii TaxID=564305 RepID=A0ABZ1D303_9TREE|nr:hypothetical protein IL334_005178 [Kwoniella shivajii]
MPSNRGTRSLDDLPNSSLEDRFRSFRDDHQLTGDTLANAFGRIRDIEDRGSPHSKDRSANIEGVVQESTSGLSTEPYPTHPNHSISSSNATAERSSRHLTASHQSGSRKTITRQRAEEIKSRTPEGLCPSEQYTIRMTGRFKYWPESKHFNYTFNVHPLHPSDDTPDSMAFQARSDLQERYTEFTKRRERIPTRSEAPKPAADFYRDGLKSVIQGVNGRYPAVRFKFEHQSGDFNAPQPSSEIVNITTDQSPASTDPTSSRISRPSERRPHLRTRESSQGHYFRNFFRTEPYSQSTGEPPEQSLPFDLGEDTQAHTLRWRGSGFLAERQSALFGTLFRSGNSRHDEDETGEDVMALFANFTGPIDNRLIRNSRRSSDDLARRRALLARAELRSS